MSETHHNYVGGEWTEASTGETFAVQNPADTDTVVARFQQSDETDAKAAVAAADAAAGEWAETPGPDRGAVLNSVAKRLERRQDALTRLLSREEGKTTDEARPEVQRAIDIFYYYAQKAREFGGTVRPAGGDRRRLYTVKEPMGVAGVITPWNYPIAIPAWKIAPALATGNTVLFKPAPQAPGVGREIVKAVAEAGVPDGVINLVTGPGESVGETFVTDERVDAVSFTGSSTVGNHVYNLATDAGKRAQTEMGGKNPVIVTESADVAEAVAIVGTGAFGVTGQACTAGSRAIVDSSIADAFLNGIVEHAESIEVGAGTDGADMGPQISQAELEGTMEYIAVGQEEATLLTGGSQPAGAAGQSGHFVEPTVFANVTPEMRIAREEIFGPVLSVLTVDGFDEAVEIANHVPYGLSASVVTDSHEQVHEFIQQIESGVVKVNEKTTGLELHVPFGGVKDSSSNTFREQGEAGLEFFTTTKTVYENY
jgi:2,5-dioxopentanoate dehydrogenase (EC 1.2.1.26)